MDREEFFKSTTGRQVYIAFTDAIRNGATLADLEEVSRDALSKAFKSMSSAGIEN